MFERLRNPMKRYWLGPMRENPPTLVRCTAIAVGPPVRGSSAREEIDFVYRPLRDFRPRSPFIGLYYYVACRRRRPLNRLHDVQTFAGYGGVGATYKVENNILYYYNIIILRGRSVIIIIINVCDEKSLKICHRGPHLHYDVTTTIYDRDSHPFTGCVTRFKINRYFIRLKQNIIFHRPKKWPCGRRVDRILYGMNIIININDGSRCANILRIGTYEVTDMWNYFYAPN